MNKPGNQLLYKVLEEHFVRQISGSERTTFTGFTYRNANGKGIVCPRLVNVVEEGGWCFYDKRTEKGKKTYWRIDTLVLLLAENRVSGIAGSLPDGTTTSITFSNSTLLITTPEFDEVISKVKSGEFSDRKPHTDPRLLMSKLQAQAEPAPNLGAADTTTDSQISSQTPTNHGDENVLSPTSSTQKNNVQEDLSSSYMNDPKKRVAIERAAVNRARQHYEANEFQVEERGKPFDLLCRKGSLIVHVEVKGTVGSGEKVILTINEVIDARNPEWRSDLFIVYGINLEQVNGEWQGRGGSVRCTEAWCPHDDDLKAVQFDYRVPNLQ